MASASNLRILRPQTWATMSASERSQLCARGLADIFDPALRSSINNIIEDVRQNGDEAVCRALATFDGVTLSPAQLAISAEEIAAATVDPALESALIDAISHLRAFNEHLMERASAWSIELEPGLFAGEKITPISSVGLFVPSGKASYPSVAYQLGVPAVVAGVKDIALLVPPAPGANGAVDPAVLVVCRLLGITRVYRANGPAGIAALGLVPRVFRPCAKLLARVAPQSPAPKWKCSATAWPP